MGIQFAGAFVFLSEAEAIPICLKRYKLSSLVALMIGALVIGQAAVTQWN